MAEGITRRSTRRSTRLFCDISCGRARGAVKTKGKGGTSDYSFRPFGGPVFRGTLSGAPALSDRWRVDFSETSVPRLVAILVRYLADLTRLGVARTAVSTCPSTVFSHECVHQVLNLGEAADVFLKVITGFRSS